MTDAPSRMTALDGGVHQGITWAIVRAPMWGAINGYVRLPEGHPWSGMDYDEVPAEANGGLTFARGGWIGFDTLHSMDLWPGGDQPHFCETSRRQCDCTVWTQDMVVAETKRLAEQVAAVAQ